MNGRLQSVRAMNCSAKFLRLLLIAALAFASSVTDTWAVHDPAFASSPMSGDPSTTCHHQAPLQRAPLRTPRSGNSPSPAPANYKCCLTGHDAAIVRSLALQQRVADCIIRIEIPATSSASAVDVPPSSEIQSPDPAHITPLRI